MPPFTPVAFAQKSFNCERNLDINRHHVLLNDGLERDSFFFT